MATALWSNLFFPLWRQPESPPQPQGHVWVLCTLSVAPTHQRQPPRVPTYYWWPPWDFPRNFRDVPLEFLGPTTSHSHPYFSESGRSREFLSLPAAPFRSASPGLAQPRDGRKNRGSDRDLSGLMGGGSLPVWSKVLELRPRVRQTLVRTRQAGHGGHLRFRWERVDIELRLAHWLPGKLAARGGDVLM